MNEEIKVTTEVVNEVEEVAKAIDWKSIGKKGGVVVVASAITYLGVKYGVKPLVKKFWKKDTEELEASDVEEIEVTELYSEDEE